MTQLQNSQSEEAKKTKKILIRLSGRPMKYGVKSMPPALLAGYMILLSMTGSLAIVLETTIYFSLRKRGRFS